MMWRRKRWKSKSTEEVTLSKRTVYAERERERCYDLLARIVLPRILFMGWAVLSFIIASFCGLSSNLYHKPNCKSYCVSFSFSYILELDQTHSPPLLHSFTAKSVKLWKQKAFDFSQVRYSSLKHHFFLI